MKLATTSCMGLRMGLRNGLCIAFCLLLSAGLTGCWYALGAGAAAAGTGVAYVRGDLETTLPNSPTEISVAAERALREMGMRHVRGGSTSQDAEVHAETDDGRAIHVSAHKLKDESGTELHVRVGMFGDQDLSRAIYDAILAKL